MIRFALVLATALALAGCAGVTRPPAPAAPPDATPPPAAPVPGPPAAPAPAAPTAAGQRTATAEALAIERQWLGAWFRDTPVKMAQRTDGALSLEVPRQFCFEPGRSSVKPALAAVLDKVAESMRRVPLARVTLAAPDDGGAGKAPLAVERAASVRDYLRSRGVPEARLGKPAASPAASVQLRLQDAST